MGTILQQPVTFENVPHRQRDTALVVEAAHTRKSTQTFYRGLSLWALLLAEASQAEGLGASASSSYEHSSKLTACSFQDQRDVRT